MVPSDWQLCRMHSFIIGAYRIEQKSFKNPMSLPDWRKLVSDRRSFGRVVRIDHGDVVGYCLYRIHKRTIGIERIAVDPIWQGQGAGHMMITDLKRRCVGEIRRSIHIDINDDIPIDSLVAFRAWGFTSRKIENQIRYLWVPK